MNIINNMVVHTIGLSTMIVSMLILGVFLLLFVNLNTWIHGWGYSLSMSIYLQDNISNTNRDNVKSFLKGLPSAEISRFISKERALKDLKDALGSQAGLLEGLSDNPLPASFEVILREVGLQQTDLDNIKEELQGIEGVEEVQFSEEWLKRFKALMDMVRLVGIIVGGLLCFCVLFIVTNTIKLTIYSHKGEIEILKLVGATDWFVKIPFLLEGIIHGILGGVIVLVVLFLGYVLFFSKKMCLLDLAVLDFNFLPFEYGLLIFLLSVTLGLVGSFVAVGRFFDI